MTFIIFGIKVLTTMNKILKGGFILATALLISCGTVSEKRTVVLIKTEFGEMKVELYNETPKHRDNFLKLVKAGYYDGVLFHRVIKEFMIQGGDPDSRNEKPDQQLGNGGPAYTIDSEINPKFLHQKGALAAARQSDDVNPGKKSSGSQFYIVQGLVFPGNNLPALEAKGNEKMEQSYMRQLIRANEDSLKLYQQSGNQMALAILLDRLHTEALANVEKTPFKLTEEQKKVYTSVGGTPHLDGNYTVFGQVIEGLSVIDAIAAQPIGPNDRPKKDIKMEIRVLKE